MATPACVCEMVRSAVARVAQAAGAQVAVVQLTMSDMATPARVCEMVCDAVRLIAAGCETKPKRQAKPSRALLGGLDIPSLGADAYTGNLHKWCCTPKGAAFLWVSPSKQGGILPRVTSHGFGLGFRGEFLWQGTQDLTAWMSVPAALAVLRALGPQTVASHNDALVRQAAAELQKMWGPASSGPLDRVGGDESGATAGMLALKLPWPKDLFGRGPTQEDALVLHERLRDGVHNVEVPIIFVEAVLWVRISAQIYNELDDYKRLGHAVLDELRVMVDSERGVKP
eukprot:gene3400-13441_t